jgi:hypothetical protein
LESYFPEELELYPQIHGYVHDPIRNTEQSKGFSSRFAVEKWFRRARHLFYLGKIRDQQESALLVTKPTIRRGAVLESATYVKLFDNRSKFRNSVLNSCILPPFTRKRSRLNGAVYRRNQ